MSIPIEETRHRMLGSAAGRRWLDFLEKCALLAVYAAFLQKILQAVVTSGSLSATLIGVSETIVLVLILFRKPAEVLSRRPLDWFLAFGGTLTPMLLRPVESQTTPLRNVAVMFCFIGLGVQIFSKLHLGRRFGMVAANRGIYARGPYELVRHPIYLGYLITHLAFVVASPSPWNFGVLFLIYSFQIPRIFVEESLLRADQNYQAYCSKVRWRLVPGLL